MTVPSITLPDSAGPIIVAEVARYGQRDLETGGFLLAPSSRQSVITTVAMAREKGIERSWGLFRISGLAIDRIFEWAESRDMRIPAQFHSHMLGGALSPTDKKHGFNIPGFVSCVVPEFLSPRSQPAAWAWWVFDNGLWVTYPPPLSGAGDVAAVWFDEDGVQERA